MAVLDVVEYLDPIGDVLAARVPEHGSGEFRLGSQCIVRDGQVALFCVDGRAMDMLEPGRHTLNSNNIPLLVDLLSIPFGGRSPFRADVYFVNMHQMTDLRWGTSQPIPVRDQQFGVVRLRAFGTYIIQVDNPSHFVPTIVGTRGRYTRTDIEDQLRSIIVTRMADKLAELMAQQKLSIVDLASEYNEISSAVGEGLWDDFSSLGLRLVRFYVNTISVPEEVEKMIDKSSGVQVFGGMQGYTQFKAAEALGDAAKAGGDNIAGAGVGLGAGLQLGQILGGALGQQGQQGQQPQQGQQAPTGQQAPAGPQAPAPPTIQMATCKQCSEPLPPGAKFCPNCGTAAPQGPAHCTQCGTELPGGAKFCPNCGNATG
jgi:membrane protease subunit (stomatin/prohibitin family)